MPTSELTCYWSACALVDADGRVLVAQRPAGKSMAGLWEFPGGKIEADETPEAALIRELKEELSIDVTAACLAPLSFASHGYDGFHLADAALCLSQMGRPGAPRESQQVKWLRPRDLFDLPMPEADKPLIAALRDANLIGFCVAGNRRFIKPRDRRARLVMFLPRPGAKTGQITNFKTAMVSPS